MSYRIAGGAFLTLALLAPVGAQAERALDLQGDVGVSPSPASPAPGFDATEPLRSGPEDEVADPQPVLLDLPMRGKYASDVFLPGLPGIGIFDPAAELEQIDETQLIQLVYDAYSRYSATEDGERARFTFHDFRTIYRNAFDEVAYYPDLVTLTRDWKLRAVIHSQYHNDVPQGVQYKAEWVPTDLLKYAGSSELLGKSLLEFVEVVADAYPHWRRMVALTSVDLTVEFAGRSERYRAGVIWHLDDEGALKFVVVDNVVPEIPFAVSEENPPLFGPQEESLRPFESITGASGAGSPTCTQETWPAASSGQLTETSAHEHNSGRHEAVFIGEFGCWCDSGCASRCTPSISVEACQDYGDLIGANLIHQASPRSEIRSGTTADGHVAGAGCAAGLGCAIQSCQAFSCGGVQINISGGIGGLSFSTPAVVIMMASLSHAHSCGTCTEQIPPNEQPATADPGDTPIVVDLDRGGFRLTGLAGGVEFDVDADGAAERVAWTAAGSEDAWLALDRNGNGRVDDGGELFGNHTPQPPSSTPHGYLALAVFDEAAEGGDGDGWITAADAAYSELRLWTDRDRDGVSQPTELSTLAERGVEAIDLRFVESRRKDRHGNQFRYTSRVRLERGTTHSADVFLLTEELE